MFESIGVANLVNDALFAKFFPISKTTEDLTSDPPKLSSPFALLLTICQNFTPPTHGI